MLTAIAMSFIAVLAFFVTACRVMPLRRLLGYGTALDVSFTLGIAALFYGTLTGLLIATIAGLVMAITISILRPIVGYDRAAAIYWTLRGPRVIWTHQPPTWQIWTKWKSKRKTKTAHIAPASAAPSIPTTSAPAPTK